MPVTQFHQQVRDFRHPSFDPKGYKHIRVVPLDDFMRVYRALEALGDEGWMPPASIEAERVLQAYAP